MAPIEVYSMATPNGIKVGLALEEMGLPHNDHLIHIMKDDQFKEPFLSINPNSKIPAIVDPDGPDGKPINVFESGAILIYLAEKTGKFLPTDPRLRMETIQWLMFQMGGVGPMFGQFGHFFKYAAEKCTDPYPKTRYTKETKRLLAVLDKRLEGREYLIDAGYTIADMATVPWVYCLTEFYGGGDELEISSFKNVIAWRDRIMARPGWEKGVKVCKP